MYRLIDYGVMVRDRGRIDAYRRALAAVVTPSTVVLDLGAGLGTFSVMASKLGAARVYAIDAADVITVAEEVARANGVGDRIRFLQARSTEVELPERVDVIVSDLAGALPLFEEHLPSLVDARTRFLKPGGVLMPHRSRLFCAPVSNAGLYARILDPWRAVPEVDLAPAAAMALQTPHPMTVTPEDLCGLPRLWGELDFTTLTSPNVDGAAAWKVDKPVHGIALWFESTLHGDIVISSGPSSPESVHATMVLPLAQPLEGRDLHLTIHAALAAGRYVVTWHARTERQAGVRQSTFFSEPRSATALAERGGQAILPVRLEDPDGQVCLASTTYRVPERVLARPVGEELLLLDPASGLYHVLNPTGAQVWRGLEQGRDVEAIVASIAAEFDVDRERAARDVAAIVAELQAARLLEGPR